MKSKKKHLLVVGIVLAVVLLLAAALWLISCLPAISTAMQRRVLSAKLNITRVHISQFKLAIQMYVLDCGAPPTQAQGLNALSINPGTPGWSGPYIEGSGIPTDPWGLPFRYRIAGTNVVVESAGPDLKFGTADDIF